MNCDDCNTFKMSCRRTIKRVTALDAQTAAGYSSAINVSDYQHITFAHAGAASSDQVIKLQGAIGIQGANGTTPPTFSSAQAVGNAWDYIDSIDLEDAASIDGDTGVTFAGADVRQFSANVDGLDWISFQVVSGSAGAITTTVSCYSNE